tara:strand:+ start:242 stop:601 length:360 start_codon:yes stop_codon:yes gene_type:complete
MSKSKENNLENSEDLSWFYNHGGNISDECGYLSPASNYKLLTGDDIESLKGMEKFLCTFRDFENLIREYKRDVLPDDNDATYNELLWVVMRSIRATVEALGSDYDNDLYEKRRKEGREE